MVTGSQREMLQGALSAHSIPASLRLPVLREILLVGDTSALLRDAVMSSSSSLELDLMKSLLAANEWKTATPSKEIVLEMLTAAVLRERNPDKIASVLAMVHADMSWTSRSILMGLVTQGTSLRRSPVKLAKAPAIFKQAKVGMDTGKQQQDQLQLLATMFSWPGHTPDPQQVSEGSALADADLEQFALGRKHYLATCAGCHGSDGAGMKRMAPPLAGSDWVLGNEKRLALLILHGLEGPVDVAGKKYDAPDILPVMPSHSTMDDGAIRAVMTYIRNEWGNHAPAIQGRLVGRTRHTSQGRVQPWTPAELNAFIEKNPEVPEPQ
jgi:mono/diheme cytochrome c family protein